MNSAENLGKYGIAYTLCYVCMYPNVNVKSAIIIIVIDIDTLEHYNERYLYRIKKLFIVVFSCLYVKVNIAKLYRSIRIS